MDEFKERNKTLINMERARFYNFLIKINHSIPQLIFLKRLMLRTPVEKLKIINFREDVQNKIKYAKANSSNVYDRKFLFFLLLLNLNFTF